MDNKIIPSNEYRVDRSAAARGPVERRAEPPAAKGKEFDPRLLWVTFRRCWLWAVPLGLALASVAAYAVFATFVPMYEATHLLEKNQDYVVFKGVMPDSRNLASSEKQLIYTDMVLDEVLAKPDIQTLPGFADTQLAKDTMRKNMKVGGSGSANLTISYQDPDPQHAALICNEIVEAYLTRREQFDNERVANLESWLSPSIDLWKEEVAGHGRRVRELSKAAYGFDPTLRVEGLENDLAVLGTLRVDLANLIVEESILEAKIAMRKAGGKNVQEVVKTLPEITIPEPTSAEIARYVASDSEVAKHRGLLVDRENKIRGMEDAGFASLRKDHYEDLKKQADELRKEVEAAEKVARDRAPEVLQKHAMELAQRERESQLANLHVSTQASLASQEVQLAELKSKRSILQQEYDLEKARLEQKGGDAADLRFAQEDREIAVGILSQLNARLAAIRTERRRGMTIQTLAAAKPPSKPLVPVPVKKMVVAGGAAFMIPFLFGLLLEFRSQRICDASGFDGQSLAPVIGEVARLPSRAGSGKRQRVFEESIDTLRANLMLSKDTRDVRTISVASSLSGEGKSSVSSQLAISLAKACGETILLIDADLRKPDQHAIFGLEMGPGLTRVLSEDVKLEDAVDKSLGDLVHVLPAGLMHQSPHRLLNSSAIRDLLDQALAKYRYVVIDTAPVLAAGETLAIAAETDATLVCMMRDLSRTDTAIRSQRRLEAAGANVVGSVFSGVPYQQYSYRYGDYNYLMAPEANQPAIK